MVLELEDTVIHYEVRGEGIPLILIHGMNVDYHLMYGCFEPIFQSLPHYMRVYLDIPGLGESVPGKNLHSDHDLVQTLLTAIHNIIGEKKYLISGESFGCHLVRGIIEVDWNRILGVCFLCPWLNDIEQNLPSRQTIIKDQNYLSTLSKEDQEEFDFMGVVQTEDTYERFRRDIKPYLPLANREFLLKLEYIQTFDHTICYDFPTTFIEARQDHAAGYEAAYQLLKNFPRASYSVIDCAGHNIQLERVRIFEELIIEWLERTKQ